MSNGIEVTIKEFKEKREEWIIKYSEYLNKLAVINKAETADINAMPEEKYIDKFELYCKNYPESVQNYKANREALKQEFGEYSSYDNCPFYCIVHNKKELDEYYSNVPENERGEGSAYYYNLKGLEKFKNKVIQDECHRDVHGKFIGIAFYIDQDYWIIKDEKTNKEKMFLNADYFYGDREERSYNIVTTLDDKGYY